MWLLLWLLLLNPVGVVVAAVVVVAVVVVALLLPAMLYASFSAVKVFFLIRIDIALATASK